MHMKTVIFIEFLIASRIYMTFSVFCFKGVSSMINLPLMICIEMLKKIPVIHLNG